MVLLREFPMMAALYVNEARLCWRQQDYGRKTAQAIYLILLHVIQTLTLDVVRIMLSCSQVSSDSRAKVLRTDTRARLSTQAPMLALVQQCRQSGSLDDSSA
jgi:hypothetical protein